jgi:uracil-DNA glycosylase family 4
MKLTGLWISAVVRCAPPANKPTPGELRNCAPWLDEEIALLRDLRVVVCLGKIAFDGFLNHQLRAGRIAARAGFEFRHGAEYAMPGGITLLASYHPSLQNTNTGKLTRAMFLDVFERARQAAGSG